MSTLHVLLRAHWSLILRTLLWRYPLWILIYTHTFEHVNCKLVNEYKPDIEVSETVSRLIFVMSNAKNLGFVVLSYILNAAKDHFDTSPFRLNYHNCDWVMFTMWGLMFPKATQLKLLRLYNLSSLVLSLNCFYLLDIKFIVCKMDKQYNLLNIISLFVKWYQSYATFHYINSKATFYDTWNTYLSIWQI